MSDAPPDVVKVDIFMPLYIADYERDTADLSFEEHGFYLAVIRALWTRKGVLRVDDKPRLARVLRTDVETLDRLWPSIDGFLTRNADGTVSQKRLSLEIERAKHNKVTAIERARRGGIAKAAKAAKEANAQLNLPHSGVLGAVLEAVPQAVLQACSSPSPSPSSYGRDPDARARDGRAPGRAAPVQWQGAEEREKGQRLLKSTDELLKRRQAEEKRIAATPVLLADLIALRSGVPP